MSHFLKQGNTFKVAPRDALDIHDKLPAGNYTIKKDPYGNLYLEQIEGFKNPSKLYGDTSRNADRILNTFMDRPNATGVMLNGEKGSGKTLLAKVVSARAAGMGIPTIVINAAWCGDEFNTFIQAIEQPCIVLFDEFEKVYDDGEQELALTLLDGVFPSKKLFMLTCNDKWRVNSHMRNRPGRIFYLLDFKGLGQDFIIEYCTDNLKPEYKSHTDKICQVATLFPEFNFDMLKALVEEINRYGETPTEALRMLNAKPEFSESSRYEIELRVDGEPVKLEHIHPGIWEGNPLRERGIHVEYDPEPDNDDVDWKDITFTHQHLKKVEATSGKFIFVNDKGHALTLTRKKDTYWHYDAF